MSITDLRNHTATLTLDDITAASNPYGPETTVLVTPDQQQHLHALLRAQAPLTDFGTGNFRWHGSTIEAA